MELFAENIVEITKAATCYFSPKWGGSKEFMEFEKAIYIVFAIEESLEAK